MASFVDSVQNTKGVELLHRSADPDHNRMVIAYRGSPDAVVAATIALGSRVVADLDLRNHSGAHPRIGALDVVPFVVGPDVTEADALGACRSVGRWAAAEGIPVFYYERAASSPDRASLPRIRSGQFEGLVEKLGQPEWRPDDGPDTPHPSAGAVVIGLRDPLVRFNVNLDTIDVEPARTIAHGIRASNGGLPHVRALGLALTRRGLTQVSMNLTRFEVTSIVDVYERITREAARLGVALVGSELIGPVPAAALERVDLARMAVKMSSDQVLDLDTRTEPKVSA